jgi:HEAT repeat protein
MMHPYLHKVSQAIKVAVVGVSLPLLLSSAGLAQQNVKQEAIQVDPRIKAPIELLMDDNEDNDQGAISQLSQIPDVVDILIQELETNQNPEVIAFVLKALSKIAETTKISPQQADDITNLIIDNKLTSNSEQLIRFYSISALSKIAPQEKTQKTLQTFFNALKDNDPAVRSRTADAINSLLQI